MKKSSWCGRIVAIAAVAIPVFAQSDSRLAEIGSQQEQKAAHLERDEPGRLERGLLALKEHDLINRFSAGVGGFRAKLGGMGAGTGFGIGPEYSRGDLLCGQLNFRAGAQTSFRGDRRFDMQLSAPKAGGGRYFAEVYAVHHDYPRINYYGPGPDSEKTGRTDFRLEDTAVDGALGVRPTRRLTLGTSAGYLWNNVGHGTDPRFASAETVYSPAQATGIDVQTNYVRAGGFAQYDWRDNPDGPRRGGNYFAQISNYQDQTARVYTFQRLDLEAQQYVPVLNNRRVFALRAKSVLTYADDSRGLPFYMQPALGGADDLRGYRAYRFRGDNLVVMNAEYRWEVFSGLDMALFGDAGQVFTRKADLDLGHLESDAGFGFRFNARDKTFLRIDVAFSHEGFQVWVKFKDVFKKGPVHTSSNMGDI
jgi:outer membrane protein assembly factor BamA